MPMMIYWRDLDLDPKSVVSDTDLIRFFVQGERQLAALSDAFERDVVLRHQGLDLAPDVVRQVNGLAGLDRVERLDNQQVVLFA